MQIAKSILCVGLVGGLLATTAFAQPAAETPSVTVSWSPLHLVLNIVELSGEVAATDNLGVGVMAGAGKWQGITIWEVGAQANYYLLARFKSLHVGGSLEYLHASTSENDEWSAEGVSRGLVLSGHLGYKYIHRSGFTFLAQAGVGYLAVESTVDGSASATDDSKVLPTLNLNVGWSF